MHSYTNSYGLRQGGQIKSRPANGGGANRVRETSFGLIEAGGKTDRNAIRRAVRRDLKLQLSLPSGSRETHQ